MDKQRTKKQRTQKTEEETKGRSTCVEPIIRLTREQEIIQYLNDTVYKLRKGYYTPDQVNEMHDFFISLRGASS